MFAAGSGGQAVAVAAALFSAPAAAGAQSFAADRKWRR